MLTISGAYGRDYKSKAAIVADLKAGDKDFIVRSYGHGDGTYINGNDLAGTTVQVRYGRDRKVTIVECPA